MLMCIVLTLASQLEIPRPYVIAPVHADDDWPEKWYVVTRGTCVGIFTTLYVPFPVLF